MNCAGWPVPVADAPPAPPPLDIDTMEGFVALPASHEGTGTLLRVTITSAGAAEGQPAEAVMVVVAAGADWLGWCQMNVR